jgi:NAD(P)H-nitrite reductase large subunit
LENTMTHHVILGAGPAGVIAAETIRKHAPGDTITLIGDEPDAPYSRMAIPYLLIGNIDERGTYLRKSDAHFDELCITQVKAKVTRVDSAGKTVHLDNGKSMAFDKLLIATGSHPVRPPIAGMDLPGVHPCWTLEDARAMEALAARGVKLSVVEMGDRMVPRMMGPVAGGMIRDWCEAKGVQVFTGTKVEAISQGAEKGLLGKLAAAVGLGSDDASGALQVRLSNGQTVEADLVISATGVRPAIGFLKDSGITCLQGVLTNEHLQTNVPGIYAAGDCAEAFDMVSGKTIVSAIQPNAAEQARVAALNMLGQKAVLKGVTQINVLDTLGLISTSFGNWEGVAGGQSAVLTDKAAGRHLSLQFKDDVMIGCNSVGWTEHVGVMRGLVEGQVHLGGWKDRLMHDPTKLVDAYLDCAQGQGRWSGAADARRR